VPDVFGSEGLAIASSLVAWSTMTPTTTAPATTMSVAVSGLLQNDVPFFFSSSVLPLSVVPDSARPERPRPRPPSRTARRTRCEAPASSFTGVFTT